MNDNIPDENEQSITNEVLDVLKHMVEQEKYIRRFPNFYRSFVIWIYDIWDELCCRWQRMQYGYCYADAWTGSEHALLVIAGLAEELRINGDGGYPIELDDDDRDGLVDWHTILWSIEVACRRYALCLQHPENIEGAELNWAESEADNALLLFAKWYSHFHE
jgi:hypothetical protein